jgi:hypothetical protein
MEICVTATFKFPCSRRRVPLTTQSVIDPRPGYGERCPAYRIISGELFTLRLHVIGGRDVCSDDGTWFFRVVQNPYNEEDVPAVLTIDPDSKISKSRFNASFEDFIIEGELSSVDFLIDYPRHTELQTDKAVWLCLGYENSEGDKVELWVPFVFVSPEAWESAHGERV